MLVRSSLPRPCCVLSQWSASQEGLMLLRVHTAPVEGHRGRRRVCEPKGHERVRSEQLVNFSDNRGREGMKES